MTNRIFNGRRVGTLQSEQWNALHRAGWFKSCRPKCDITIPEFMRLAAVLTQPAEVVAKQLDDGTFEAEATKYFEGISLAEIDPLFRELSLSVQAFLDRAKMAQAIGPTQ